MRLTAIGCSGSFPGPDSPGSSYLVEHEGFRLLLDLGSGALGPLQRHADLLEIDAVVLSHLHADHCLDMCSYVVFRRYHPAGVPPRLPVYGPRGTHGRLAAAYEPTSTESLNDVFSFNALVPGQRELGPFQVQVDRVDHPVETFAVRLSAGNRTLTYSGDTGPSDALVKLAAGSDVLLCEASFENGDGPAHLHLSGQEAGEHARRAGVGRLLVTHIPPWSDRVRIMAAADAAFNGPIEEVAASVSYDI